MITILGSTNTDMVVKTATFPRPGETLIGGEFFMFSGGKGANQAVAAARMGGQVRFVSRVGDDIFGQRALEEFRKEGIDTRSVSVDKDSPSGTALILVNGEGENEIVVAPGSNGTLTEREVDDAQEAIEGADILLMQLEVPLSSVVHAARLAHAKGVKVILNPAPARVLQDELYPLLHLITPNETEAEILTGISVSDETSQKKAAVALLAKGVAHVILTLGSRGVYYTDGSIEIRVPAPEVDVVDTTAAGDVFNGVLAVGLSQSLPWEAAMSLAVKAASLSVTKMGAQASMPYSPDLP
jgi:ribokinase